MLWGYGAILACHMTTRGPCLEIGDLSNSNDYINNLIAGVSFQSPELISGAAFTGSLISNTQYALATATNTITTSAAHGLRNNDSVVIMATDNAAYWGDVPRITVTDSTHFTYTRTRSSDIALAPTPGIVALSYEAILDNSVGTHFLDVKYDLVGENGHFNNFFDFWDDENALIENFNNSGIGLTKSNNWIGSYVLSAGANNLPNNSQQLAPVISIITSTFTAQSSSCFTILNSNGFYVKDTVCQASGPWQAKVSNLEGNFQGADFANLYSENNAGSNTSSPWPNMGVAGLLAGASASASTYTIRGNGSFAGAAGLPVNGSGSTTFVYMIVAKDMTAGTQTAPLPAMYWKQGAASTPTVSWPRVASGADTIKYDVLRVPAPNGTMATVNGGFVGPAQGTNGCPGNSVNACGSIAVNVAQCAGFVCSIADNTANNTTAYSVGTYTFAASPDFWPGQAVMTNSTLFADKEQIAFGVGMQQNGGSSSNTGSFVEVANACGAGLSVTGGVATCLATASSNGEPFAPATILGDTTGNTNGANAKGRIGFQSGFSIWPHDIITFMDCKQYLTQATTGYRPAQSPCDVAIGLDQLSNGNETVEGNTARMTFRSPLAFEWFHNVVPNPGPAASATNWTEQMTSTTHKFKDAIAFSNVLISNASPSISGAACGGTGAALSGTPNGTASFAINVGSTPGISCTITMPASTGTGWNCSAFDRTSPTIGGGYNVKETADSTTSVVLTFYNTAGTATSPTASDVVRLQCGAY